MLLPWLVAASQAQVIPTCEKVGLAQVAEVDPPAVVVLGERRGIWPDLVRAERLIRRLSRDQPVTLALQAVQVDQQPVLDQLAEGRIAPADLPELTGWNEYWGIPFAAYEGLMDLIPQGVHPIAAGVGPEARPPEATLPMAPGYLQVLLDAIGDHAMPVVLEPEFVERVAWMDHRIARRALEAWDGQGVLVILVDRLHVEGGKGVSWQAQHLTEHPVSAVLLADAQTPCYPGDRVWRDHPFDR